MGIARSSFYFQKKLSDKRLKDQRLSEKIEQIQKQYFFTIGRRRMGSLLKRSFGLEVGESQIQRLMRAYHLSARIRQIQKVKPHAGKAYLGQLPENLLNRQFLAEAPMHRLVTDVTYVPYYERGQCNTTMECFNGTFKVEALYNVLWAKERPSFMEQNTLIAEYIDFYNDKRPCSVLGNVTQNQYKSEFLEKQNVNSVQ